MVDTKDIKIGKVIQLIPHHNGGFNIELGIRGRQKSLMRLQVRTSNWTDSLYHFNGGVHIHRDGTGYIIVNVINATQHRETDVEDTLLVIVDFARNLVTSAKLIDEKLNSHGEAVLFMREGDTVELCHLHKDTHSAYVAIRCGNELRIVKKEKQDNYNLNTSIHTK